MEEITHILDEAATTTTVVGAGKKKERKKGLPDNLLIDLVIREYEDVTSPAFGRNAATVRSILLRKYPGDKLRLTPAFVRTILESHSSTYSMT